MEKNLTHNEKNLKSLTVESYLAKERERRRIAVVLHDHVGQKLAASRMKLDRVYPAQTNEEMRREIDEVCAWLGEAIEETRSLTFDLSSPLLYDLGWEPAIERLVEDIKKEHNLHLVLENDSEDKPLSRETQIILCIEHLGGEVDVVSAPG